jgi:monofunctional biosynthetic peptidoglycan transglycosylase
VRELRTHNLDRTAFMRLREDEARAAGREPRHLQHWIPYNRISPNLKRAVLVAEDAGFWGHEGIDLVEIKKSLETDWEKGLFLRGASTITQQLAKNLYLSPSRNPFRKLRELIIARRLEHDLTKTRIFELYLNDIEWGDGIYGADAAARTYFGVSAASLDPDQAALMAGAIVNPRELKIFKPNARLRNRQRIIRARMGGITPPPALGSTVTGQSIDQLSEPDPATDPASSLEELVQPDETPPAEESEPPAPQPFPGFRER